MNVDVTDYNIMFGQYLKLARESQKIDQLELAEMVGISQSYLSYLELGQRRVDLALAFRLGKAVNMDFHDLVDKFL